MKKLLTYLAVLILVCATCTPAAAEQTAERSEPEEHTCGDFSYIVLDDGTAEIVRFNALEDELTIPDELKMIDSMTDTELNAKLQHSFEQSLKGEGRPFEEVFDEVERSLQ